MVFPLKMEVQPPTNTYHVGFSLRDAQLYLTWFGVGHVCQLRREIRHGKGLQETNYGKMSRCHSFHILFILIPPDS